MNNIIIETTRKALNTRIKMVTKTLNEQQTVLNSFEKSFKNKKHDVDYSAGFGIATEYNEESTMNIIEEVKGTIERCTSNIKGYTHALSSLEGEMDSEATEYALKALRVTAGKLYENLTWWEKQPSMKEKFAEGLKQWEAYQFAINAIR